jgi:hypothetical protein
MTAYAMWSCSRRERPRSMKINVRYLAILGLLARALAAVYGETRHASANARIRLIWG